MLPMLGKSCTHTRASVRQSSVPAKHGDASEAGKVTAGVARSNGSLLLGLANVSCGLSASEIGDQHRPLRSLGLSVYLAYANSATYPQQKGYE